MLVICVSDKMQIYAREMFFYLMLFSENEFLNVTPFEAVRVLDIPCELSCEEQDENNVMIFLEKIIQCWGFLRIEPFS